MSNVPNCFIVGSLDPKRITIATQQARGFALSEMLLATGAVTPATRIAVVGGGFAGLAVSASLAGASSELHLFERATALLPLQRGNHTRFVHPNLYDWPDDRAINDYTTFPFMNWSADYAGAVASQILLDWRRLSRRVQEHLGWMLRKIEKTSSYHRLFFSHGESDEITRQEDFDLVILCPGFGWEQPGNFSSSYWRDDALHQVPTNFHARFAIVGCGDGGLTDALRLKLRDFDHKGFLSEVLRQLDLRELGQRLTAIDVEAEANANPSAYLAGIYDRIDLPPNLTRLVATDLRHDTTVRMFGLEASPWRPDTSLLNRLLLLSVMRAGGLDYISGRFDPAVAVPGEQVVARRGPQPAIGAIEGLYGLATDWRTYDKASMSQGIASASQFPHISRLQKVTPTMRVRILVIHNKEFAHTAQAIHRMVGELDKHLSRKNLSLSTIFRSFDPAAEDVEEVLGLVAEIRAFRPDYLVIISSDLTDLMRPVWDSGIPIILVGGSPVIDPIFDELIQRGNEAFAISQLVDLRDVCMTIEAGFPGLDLAFLTTPTHPTDLLYFEKLEVTWRALHEDAEVSFGLRMINLQEVDLYNLRGKADIFTGRYAIHGRSLTGIFDQIPFVSGYMPEFHLGAVACRDSCDVTTARWLVDRVLLPLIAGHGLGRRRIILDRRRIAVNLGQAQRFGLQIGERLIEIADEIVE